ncbi:MAG: flagellar export protein FliJ, partial [Bdellovibrionales bacterium]
YNIKKAEIQVLHETLQSARQQASTLVSQTGGQVMESLKQIQDFIVLQDIRIEQENKKLAEIGKLVEAKREVLQQKARDKKILERLETRKREEFQAEEARREQKEADDNVSMRFEILKKNGSS